MRYTILFAFAASAFAQAPLKVVAVSPAGTPVSIRQQIRDVEKRLDTSISQVGGKEPESRVYILGLTRGLYLDGYGAVFTQELDLIETPHPSPFQLTIPPAEVASVHQRKLANLAALQKALREMWGQATASLTAMPDSEQVVLSVRLFYQPWEITAGLPSQIILKGARKTSPGEILMEEE